MEISLKPLTAVVTLNNDDSASITVKNDKGTIVLGPLTHHMLSHQEDWKQSIKEHIDQLVKKGMNITDIQVPY